MQRIGADRAIVPEIESGAPIRPSRDHNLDSLVFDKADQVERVEDLRVRLTALDKEIADLEASAKTASVEEAEKAKETIFLLQKIRERLVEKSRCSRLRSLSRRLDRVSKIESPSSGNPVRYTD